MTAARKTALLGGVNSLITLNQGLIALQAAEAADYGALPISSINSAPTQAIAVNAQTMQDAYGKLSDAIALLQTITGA